MGATVAGDRIYAIENGPSGFDPAAPAYLPKIRFLMLMRNERLARLATHYDDTTRVLTIREGGAEVARGRLTTPEGRAAIEAFFARFSEGDLRGPPKILRAPGHSFSDVAKKVVSIINLASVAAKPPPARPSIPCAFAAMSMSPAGRRGASSTSSGSEIAIGAARLKIVKRIVRCAATNVDPATGMRDLTIPETLMRTFGHADCGVYGEVVADGEIARGATVGES